MSALSTEQSHSLICRAISRKEDDGPMAAILSRMEKTLKEEMLKVTRHHSPPDFVPLFFDFQKEFERFREFSEFPELSRKGIVGFGGAFSAGKSSLLNALIGRKILPAEVDPTTTVPAFILRGKEEAISAINLFGRKILLSAEEFVALTHDYEKIHGTPMGHVLKSAHLLLPDFGWENLAFLDTPGYSRTDGAEEDDGLDARVARSQLNTAQFMVWVVRAEAGTLPEKDLNFLASLRREIPKLFILSQADKREEGDVRAIVSLIRNALEKRGIAFVDVLPFSARKKSLYPKEAIIACFDRWNTRPREVLFARNFKVLFIRFIRYLDERKRDAERSLNRLNRVLTLADDGDIRKDIEELQSRIQREHRQLEEERNILLGLSATFFRELKGVGDRVGIEIPEPSEMDLLSPDRTDLLEQLRNYRQKEGIPERGCEKYLFPLEASACCSHLSKVLSMEGNPAAHMAGKYDAHTRERYLTLLTALALQDKKVSENESRLIRLLQDSLGLEVRLSALFEQAGNLDGEGLKDFFRAMGEADLHKSFLLDGLILCRLDGPLNPGASEVLAHLVELFAVGGEELKILVGLSCHILGIEGKSWIPMAWNTDFYRHWEPVILKGKLTLQDIEAGQNLFSPLKPGNTMAGTVLDEKTGLEWMRCSLGQTWNGRGCTGEAKEFQWDEAMKAAKKFNAEGGYCGHRDWRLPTIEELNTLVYCSSGKRENWQSGSAGGECEGNFQNPTINLVAFPDTPASAFWSSSQCLESVIPASGFWSSSPSASGRYYAWNLHFGSGCVSYSGKGYSYQARLVRGGQ